MNLKDLSSIDRRSVEAFFSKIRTHLDEIEPIDPKSARPATDKLKHLKEEQKYGVIQKKDLDKILSKYDPVSEKPIKSDHPIANSFAKLLYSRPGFHQISSTDYLLEVLNIKDRDRDSFLGGHSTYAISEDETLQSVRLHHHKMYLRHRSQELLDQMDQELPLGHNFDADVAELINRDSKNGNVLAVRGKNNLRKKLYKDAIRDLKSALNSNCDFIPRVKIILSEALHLYGFELYNRSDYEGANEYFMESLQNNPEHSGSRLHSEMCSRQVQQRHRRFGERQHGWTTRRR